VGDAASATLHHYFAEFCQRLFAGDARTDAAKESNSQENINDPTCAKRQEQEERETAEFTICHDPPGNWRKSALGTSAFRVNTAILPVRPAGTLPVDPKRYRDPARYGSNEVFDLKPTSARGKRYFAASTRQKTRTLERSQNTAHKLALVRRSLKIREPSWTAPRSSYFKPRGRRCGGQESSCASPNLGRAPVWNRRYALGASVYGASR